MSTRLMLLPCQDYEKSMLVETPDDLGEQEVFRMVTALVSEVQLSQTQYSREDISSALEDNGFTVMDFQIGPELDF
ncbi:MAG: hypothetical protein JSW10_08170 [Pseudomonadota bacterium]|nr:MAG: hypothetical protein JSW10_08170 [Pseudomonadota bacterium]